MEKMNKAYVGTLKCRSTTYWTGESGESTNLTFKNGTLRDNPWPFEPNAECYLVKKDDLDAYEARIEQLKLTSVWNENQLLTAKVKALEEKITELGVITSFLEFDNAKLKGKLSRANDELAKYNGVQEVVDIRAECNNLDYYAICWTGRDGDKHNLELQLVKSPMDETMHREMDIYE
mgnify:CR=1 FL=1